MFSFFKKANVSESNLLPSIYDYEVTKLDGSVISLSNFKNKVLIIFNSSSKCGLTGDHISQFNKLHDEYNSKGLEILAFPTRQFLNQEFNDSKDICNFNKENSIKYNMFAVIEVNGSNTHPLFQFLKSNIDSMHNEKGELKNIGWNFGKFLVDKNGNVVKYYSPISYPKSLENNIKELL